jgi:dTDP-4-amino-4,6-dideoxygalactose transaminase
MSIVPVNFEKVTEFEKKIAEFFGAPYAVAVDSCTHGLELCLRYAHAPEMHCPKNTYLSVPMLASKLRIKLNWRAEDWKDYYRVYGGIYDAAVLWKRDSYIPGTQMCVSFQYQKHLSLGRGGIILCDVRNDALNFKKMSYDGRLPSIPWREQDIDTIGYHYYMTPEIAQKGLDKLQEAIDTKPREWSITDWPDLTEMEVFKI